MHLSDTKNKKVTLRVLWWHLPNIKNKKVMVMKGLILVVLVMVSGCSYLSVHTEGDVTVSQAASAERDLQLQQNSSAK